MAVIAQPVGGVDQLRALALDETAAAAACRRFSASRDVILAAVVGPPPLEGVVMLRAGDVAGSIERRDVMG